ncbi:MAG: hypothetical protein L0H34_08470, partial [Psychrobacter sp.]|nr:hypothetical protein [Psychrobacter sp.]
AKTNCKHCLLFSSGFLHKSKFTTVEHSLNCQKALNETSNVKQTPHPYAVFLSKVYYALFLIMAFLLAGRYSNCGLIKYNNLSVLSTDKNK